MKVNRKMLCEKYYNKGIGKLQQEGEISGLEKLENFLDGGIFEGRVFVFLGSGWGVVFQVKGIFCLVV